MSEEAATRKSASADFVRLRARPRDALSLELAPSAAIEAGAAGVEERAAEDRGEEGERSGLDVTDLLVYTATRHEAAVCAALEEAGATVTASEPVEDVDWSLAWRDGLAPVEIGDRLVVVPAFLAHAPKPGQAVVAIEPGQAFGTGGHASTRLALALLCDVPAVQVAGARVLDVGTGSGVLALAALRLGARLAVGFDLDSLAAPAARENAERNGLGPGLRVFTGPAAALRPGGFDLVLANLLKRELLPVAAEVAACVRAPQGALVLAGLLAHERDEIASAFAPLGLAIAAERTETDATGDTWLGLTLRP